MAFATDCIHAGQEPDPTTGAVSVPIYQTSTYVQPELGRHKGWEYARTKNPTRSALEASVAALEGGSAGFAFASGMAALDAVLTLVRAGEHLILGHNTYGGTFRLVDKVLSRRGVLYDLVDTSNLDALCGALRPETRMVLVETPTNPVMTLSDISAVAKLCRAQPNVRLVVDNTFLSPALQKPIELGADIVVHSTTKFLNGHSDSVGGVAVVTRPDDAEWIGFVQNAAGAILSPFDSFLILRGIKTLAVRMERHDISGRKVAEHLSRHPRLSLVHYPGLDSHPQNALARRQQKGFGSMIAFETGSYDSAKKFLDTLRIIALAESLGGVESLACHPATMTHASVPAESRKKLGITDGLVRISVGLEDVEDLIAEIDAGLARI